VCCLKKSRGFLETEEKRPPPFKSTKLLPRGDFISPKKGGSKKETKPYVGVREGGGGKAVFFNTYNLQVEGPNALKSGCTRKKGGQKAYGGRVPSVCGWEAL